MSNTFYLVCHETKKRVWIGQGGGNMTQIYSGELDTMAALKRFLNDHMFQSLRFVCSSACDSYKYERYE